MLKKTAAIIIAACIMVMGVAMPASAATETTPVVAFTLDLGLVLQLVLAVFLPILVGLVTKTVTSGAVKAWLLAGLTTLTSLVAEFARSLGAGETFDVGLALLVVIPAFAISVATHYGLWKPTGVSAAAQRIGE